MTAGGTQTPNIQNYVGNSNSDGLNIGRAITDKVGLYGTAPIAQRALAAQATSLVGTASSTDVNTDLKAAIIEIMNTLAAIGAWKGAA
ncbi:MAG TPA: hypothetical protein VIM16_00895 [Mucilaginibacter sp.]|jgi:hypothetical protein